MSQTIIGALSVEITADTKGVKAGMKSAGEALDVTGKKLRKGANDWGKWALAATTAAASIAAVIVKSNLTSIRELKNTAQAANTSVEAFQRGAFAAEKFGISQEKYGDILKDVNDRVGDFLISGAGPMVDFFETVGPKIGITAEAFKGLSGEQSLGLYIKSLQEAGVSQQEMTFFMEAMASDSTRLTPLFQNNAKAFNALTKEAKDLGIGLSAIDVSKAEMASDALDRAESIIGSMGKQLTVELAPLVTAIADGFVDMAKEAGGASSFIKKGIGGATDVVGVFADGLHGVEILFKALEVGAVGFSALVANVFAGVINLVTGMVDSFTGGINKIIEVSNDFLGTDFTVIPALQSSDFVKSVNEVAENMIGLVKQTNAELGVLTEQPLPSEEVKTFVDDAVIQYERLADAKSKALGGNNENASTSSDEGGAAVGFGGEGLGTKTNSEEKINEVDVFKAETVGLLEALGVRFQSQEEMTLAHFQREREMSEANFLQEKEALAIAYADGELSITEHKERMTAIRQAESDKAAEIKQAEVDIKRQMTLMDVQQGFQILAKGSKKIQKAMEIAATAQALIKGKQAAVDAWQAGMSVGGPYAPLVAAAYTAASLANTASMIKSIKSGGSSSASRSAAPTTPSGNSGGQSSASQASEQPAQNRSIDINFSGQGFITADLMRNEIIPALNDALGDGLKINVGGG